jgi:hypothetical protein
LHGCAFVVVWALVSPHRPRPDPIYAEAEPLYGRALAIWEKSLGREHPDVAPVLENFAWLLEKTNRTVEALEAAERARAIRAKQSPGNRAR